MPKVYLFVLTIMIAIFLLAACENDTSSTFDDASGATVNNTSNSDINEEQSQIVNNDSSSINIEGTWEHVNSSSSGTVYEFTRDAFTRTLYTREGHQEVHSGTYSISSNEITFVANGGADTMALQFIGNELIIGTRAFNWVPDGTQFSFEIVEQKPELKPAG